MLLNALIHRNYMGSMVQLRVFNNKISLWNPGSLPSELTIEKLFQTHESFPRNRLIAEVCYKAGYIDAWGRGIEKIVKACKQAKLPPPVYIERTGGVVVELFKEVIKTPEAILAVLKEDNNLTLVEVAGRIDKSVSAVERAVKKLREQGKLKYIGSKKYGHWEVIEELFNGKFYEKIKSDI